MPRIHIVTFPVRHYECDAYGHVNNTNYLRFMEEAALQASADAGYDHHYYQSSGTTWLVRHTEVEFLQPLFYGDSVTVKTWVADMRHIRSIRMYELTRTGTDAVVARGKSDWAYLNRHTLRPQPITPQMASAFLPEGAPEEALPRERFPELPPPPPKPYIMRRPVDWQDIDSMQHVNNSVYAAYMGEAGVRAPAAFGWPLERFLEMGIAIVARRHDISYIDSAVAGDEIEVLTYLSDIRRSSGIRNFIIRRAADGKELVRARMLWVTIDLKSNRPVSMPQSILDDVRDHIASSSV